MYSAQYHIPPIQAVMAYEEPGSTQVAYVCIVARANGKLARDHYSTCSIDVHLCYVLFIELFLCT